MKKLLSIITAGMFVAVILLSVSCEKEEEIKAVVYVKYLADTTSVVPFAKVRMSKYDVNVEGTCNAMGVFEHSFRDEMILELRAWELDDDGQELMYGETTIRLEKGDVNKKTVYIN